MLIVECFMLLVYFLSHTPGKPELEIGYLQFYLGAIGTAGIILGLCRIFHRHRKSTTGLQYITVNFFLLWGCLFSAYDVWHGNGGVALPQLMLFTSSGFRFPKRIHFTINIGYWVIYVLLLFIMKLPQRTFYSETINSGIYLMIACSMFCIADRFQTAREQAVQKILQLQGENLDMMAAQITEVQAAVEETRLLRHDLRHIAFAVRENTEKGNYAALLEIAEGVLQKTAKLELRKSVQIFTGVPEIDSALGGCMEWGSQKNVQLSISVQRPSQVNIRAFSLVLLNSLENACIAVEHQSSGERNLCVIGEIRGSQYYLEITNSYEAGSVIIHPETGLPSAKGKTPGYGTQSIAHIIEQHQGYWRFRAGEKFQFQALFTREIDT